MITHTHLLKTSLMMMLMAAFLHIAVVVVLLASGTVPKDTQYQIAIGFL